MLSKGGALYCSSVTHLGASLLINSVAHGPLKIDHLDNCNSFLLIISVSNIFLLLYLSTQVMLFVCMTFSTNSI
jgi:hypothetical protein